MTQHDNEIKSMWRDIERSSLRLNILMGGKTGVGKSSVINAIIGQNISTIASDGNPCTKCNEELLWPTDAGDISITDVPGFGEAHAPLLDGLDYRNNIMELARNANILILVLSCADRALELEEKFILEWKNDVTLNQIPVFIVINQIDKMKPSKIWEPTKLNLTAPETQKELNIKSYIDYVSNIPAFNDYAYSNRIFPVCAGEYFGDTTYGIEALTNGLNGALPEVLQVVLFRERFSRDATADIIINSYAGACALAAVQPIPIVDSFIIAPIQIAMLIHLGKLYGVSITKATAGVIINSLGLSRLGNDLFFTIVSIFPGVKQVVGPAIDLQLDLHIWTNIMGDPPALPGWQ